jgi:aminoglycoside phosphotransferase (APT) family kinase protein
LREWLASKLPAAEHVELSALGGPAATGFSSDTLITEASWREGGRERSQGLVVRLRPTGFPVFPAYDVALQFRLQQALRGTRVPVPRMLWLEEDADLLGAPFYAMELVDGRIPTDNPPYHAGGWMTEIAPEERASIWWSGLRVLCEIHRLDWRGLGLGFVVRESRPASPLERQLEQYRRFLAWAARGKPQPVCEAALAWLVRERPREPEPVALCWGDARIGNMIFRDGRCVAALDWEMATLGNPEQDLAWWLFLDRHHSEGLGVPRLPGFPAREETLARYVEWTGRKLERLDYYEAFAGFRFAVIMIRVAQQLVHYGALPADSDFETNNVCTRLLARVLELPSPGT